ncbi:hypothetical protein DID74_02220 [Candidatus Marinamargulisbacteria bacterium SCGC AG-333-B06]|nr:hypothetical protein DID74_02220 [Candidatus Marinamargulisbacteria bacterium SCGC AG-333-B06]
MKISIIKPILVGSLTLLRNPASAKPNQIHPNNKANDTYPKVVTTRIENEGNQDTKQYISSTENTQERTLGHQCHACMWNDLKLFEKSTEKRHAIETYLTLPIGPKREKAYQKVLDLYNKPSKQEIILKKYYDKYPHLYGNSITNPQSNEL